MERRKVEKEAEKSVVNRVREEVVKEIGRKVGPEVGKEEGRKRAKRPQPDRHVLKPIRARSSQQTALQQVFVLKVCQWSCLLWSLWQERRLNT